METYPELTCYVPKLLDVTKLPDYMKRHHWKYEWVAHTILLNHLRTKSKFDAPVALSAEILKKLLGDRYYWKILKSLIDGKIIKRTNYRVGEHAYRYKINKHVLLGGIEKISVERSTIRRKVYMHRANSLNDIIKNPVQKHEFYNLSLIEINVEEAIEYIDNNYKKGTPQHTARTISVWEVDKMKNTSMADNIVQLDWMFKIDRSGRWHTPISHLARDIRQFLKSSDGERLVEIDQSCSQLTYMHKYLLEHVQGKVVKMHFIGEEGILEQTSKDQELDLNLIRYASLGKPGISSYEVQIDMKWRNAIFGGNAYQLLMDGLQWKGTRDEFKEKFFAELFYNQYREKLTRIEQAFKHYFPHEFYRLRKAKGALGNRELAVQVQRMEARFWHRWLGSMMKSKFFDVTYATIHDSMLVPESRVHDIKVAIVEHATRYFNPSETDQPIVPTFRIKS
jgi:hypothetical protein